MAKTTSSSVIGRSLPRVEDIPLVQGLGQYVSDYHSPEQWVVAIVRSTHAHARILAITTEAAETMPGVHGVFTAFNTPLLGRAMPGHPEPAQSPLAVDRVRYVGEPLAFVLADDRYLAEDAAEMVSVQYEPLDPVTTIQQAMAGPTILHPTLGSNEADAVVKQYGRGAEALDEAEVVIEDTFAMGRVSAQPIEPRGIFARYVPEARGLLVHYATQSVFGAKARIADFLHLEPSQVDVVSPDVGGGFGAKNGAYPEEFLVTWAAMTFQRPIKWSGDRFEEFLSTTHEREQVHHAKLGLTRTGYIVALTDTFYQDQGAYPNRGGIPFHHTVENLMGPYDIPHVAVHGYMMLTNKVPQAPYRGAGRPQGHFVIERLLDRAADTLGMDRAALRMKNLHTKESPVLHANFDSGNFAATFQKLLDLIEYRTFADRQREALQEGRYVGLGLANCVEISGGSGFEGARFILGCDGTVELSTGAVSHGQGHRTALAQVTAEELGISVGDVIVHEGDTRRIGRGIGTFGSRTMIMAGNAARQGAREFLSKLQAAAAEKLEAAPADIAFEHGHFFVRGVPSITMTLKDVAQFLMEEGRAALAHEAYYQSQSLAYGFGSHAVIVEVDTNLAAIRLLDYRIVHDGGRIINPLLTDGQVIGGAVQGLGTAIFEEMIYDETGQPLTTSFLDYPLPGSAELPDVTVVHTNFPSPNNPEGVKGVGEAGIIPTQAVVLSAVENALAAIGVRLNDAPITPNRLFHAISDDSRE